MSIDGLVRPMTMSKPLPFVEPFASVVMPEVPLMARPEIEQSDATAVPWF